MVPKRTDRSATHFKIFALNIISANERLHLITHRLFDGALASDCCATSGFRPAPGCQKFATALRAISSQLGPQFTLSQRPTQPARLRFYRGRLFARALISFPPQFFARELG
jgi:hypothetical protein